MAFRFCVTCTVYLAALVAAVDRSVYMDPNRPVNERVEAILEQMTLAEKQVCDTVRLCTIKPLYRVHTISDQCRSLSCSLHLCCAYKQYFMNVLDLE